MRAFRSRLAIVLLLCFARVLVPDAWILALHEHQHTVDTVPKAAPGARQADIISGQHQHCPVDHFFNVAFQPSPPLVLPAQPLAYQLPHSVAAASVWHSAAHTTADLRGPPAA